MRSGSTKNCQNERRSLSWTWFEEIRYKKIYDRLLDEANEVFKKENQLAQLELLIKEREREINVHKDLVIVERKSAEEESHNCAIELTQKLIREKNLKLKYESLINKTSKNEDGGEEKYSQAYYVIENFPRKRGISKTRGWNGLKNW